MLGWLKSVLFRESHAMQPREVSGEHPMIAEYDAFFSTRLEQLTPKVAAAFNRLSHAAISENVTTLHVEVFFDEPGFGLRLFGYSADWVEVPPDEAIESFNAEIERLWPFITESELDRFTIWEEDPKFGRTAALVQPLDAYDPTSRIKEWLCATSETCRSAMPIRITYGFHDHTGPQAF